MKKLDAFDIIGFSYCRYKSICSKYEKDTNSMKNNSEIQFLLPTASLLHPKDVTDNNNFEVAFSHQF